MTPGNNQLSGWTEKKLQSTSQSQTYAKKGHSHCLVTCCWSDPLQLSESQWNHYIWDVCSANQWDAPQTAMPAAGIGQQNGPNSSPWQYPTICRTTVLPNLNKLGYKVLPRLPHSPDLLPTNYHFFKHLDSFLQGKHFHNQQDTENVFKEFVESRSTDFFATGINRLFSRWQKCVDCNDSYFDE